MATRADVTVRIDTKLRKKASELDINMSRLLEDALRDEITRRETVAETLSEGVLVYELPLQDEDGRDYTGRITGKEIFADIPAGIPGFAVYLTTDDRVIAYSGDENEYWKIEDPEKELLDYGLTPGEYTETLKALGLKPVVDI